MFQAFQQRRWPLIILWVVIVAAIVAAPAVLPVFRLNLLGRFLSLAIVALGIDLIWGFTGLLSLCLLYTSPSPRDMRRSRMPSSA